MTKRRHFVAVIALLLVVLVAYSPAVRLILYKAGYIEKGRVANVVIEFDEGWVPLLSNSGLFGKVLGTDRPMVLFVKANGILPGWSNSIVAMKFNEEEIADMNKPPVGNPFRDDVSLPWGKLKVYKDAFGGYVPEFGVQFTTRQGRESDFMEAIREIRKIEKVQKVPKNK